MVGLSFELAADFAGLPHQRPYLDGVEHLVVCPRFLGMFRPVLPSALSQRGSTLAPSRLPVPLGKTLAVRHEVSPLVLSGTLAALALETLVAFAKAERFYREKSIAL